MTTKILQIGLGGFGKHHLRVWNEMGVEVYAADILPESLEACRAYGMPAGHAGRDYRQFLPLVDAVDVVTPADSHYSICKDALNAGKDVFVEKPFTADSAQARELRELADKKGRILQVGHIFRYNPAARYIKRLVDEGALGDLHYIYGYYAGFKRMRTDVGVTQTDSIHYFDVADFLFGGLPERVLSVQKDTLGRGLDDISITFLFYGETLVKIESGYRHPEPRRDFVLVGSKKTVEADLVKQSVRIHDNRFARKGNEWAAERGGVSNPSLGFEEPLRNELLSFRECVEKRTAPLADAEAGWRALIVVEAARRSAREGRAISLEPASTSRGL